MARIHHRKARKDYPEHGIKKGDMYYTAQIKTGPRSSRVLRSLKPLKASQMTTSPFRQDYYAMQEAWDSTEAHTAEDIRSAAEVCRELSEQASESFENMPESLQQADTGQMLENRRDECESKADDLDGFADEFEGLEEPEEPDEFEDTDEPGMDHTYDERMAEWQELHDDYATAMAELSEEQERIIGEAAELIGDMPE